MLTTRGIAHYIAKSSRFMVQFLVHVSVFSEMKHNLMGSKVFHCERLQSGSPSLAAMNCEEALAVKGTALSDFLELI